MRLFPTWRTTRHLCALLAAAALGLGPVAAIADSEDRAPAPGYTWIKSLEGVDEYRLDSNGLTVLLSPDRSTPVVNMQVTYLVGSRNEGVGTTGAAHLFEHLMFKGSKRFDSQQGNGISDYLERHGAMFNAMTAQDLTVYYAILAPEYLEEYMRIEADRMRNLLLREADLQAEMTVVRNEFERGENSPQGQLNKQVFATAFLAQGYHHPVIGWRSDIENVSIGKLREFYDTYYWPKNAVVSLVGDFEPRAVLAQLREHFGELGTPSHDIPQPYTREPPQTGPRRVVTKREGGVGQVMTLYKVPNGLHTDMPALNVLSWILTSGETHGMKKALVDGSLATSAGAYVNFQRDPGSFIVGADLAPGVKHEQLEEGIGAVIERIQREGVTAEEVMTVVESERASRAFKRDGTMGVVGGLVSWAAIGDWTRAFTFGEDIEKVTPEDVQRVAKKYLVEDQSTTGLFVPLESKNEAES
ncbi:M16 family metallopeptidase [Microbulbifer sp.]|uniref:M16 family metallopeptidase n=1 Tax=Microbulbifer sp. TaxID=1908541 RepID=UPI003F3C4252